MTKEELEKEAEEYIKANNLEWELECYRTSPIGEVKQAYIASAEPREKYIAELKKQLDLKEKALSKAKKETKRIADRVNKDKRRLIRRKAELEAQIEKLIDFVLSKTECCDVCPITDTCINSEGTCPYAGILSKGEEAVTREWLMQKIAKEIKEK